VEENLPIGSDVGYIIARDVDGPSYNLFRLSVMSSGSLSDAFIVHRSSGRVITARELDREDQDIYSIVVQATDEQNPALIGTTRITVKVLDANDHSPEFRYPTVDNSTLHIDTTFTEGQVN